MIVGDSSGRVHDCGCAAKIGGHYDPEKGKKKKKKTGGKSTSVTKPNHISAEYE